MPCTPDPSGVYGPFPDPEGSWKSRGPWMGPSTPLILNALEVDEVWESRRKRGSLPFVPTSLSPPDLSYTKNLNAWKSLESLGESPLQKRREYLCDSLHRNSGYLGPRRTLVRGLPSLDVDPTQPPEPRSCGPTLPGPSRVESRRPLVHHRPS